MAPSAATPIELRAAEPPAMPLVASLLTSAPVVPFSTGICKPPTAGARLTRRRWPVRGLNAMLRSVALLLRYGLLPGARAHAGESWAREAVSTAFVGLSPLRRF